MEKTPLRDGATAGDLSVVDEVAADFAGKRGALIPILQHVQAKVGYLSEDVMERIAERADIPAAQVFGVASFYSQFRLKPVGRHVIKVCHGTACHVQGAIAVTEDVCDELGIEDGETTRDGEFTVESVACLGCCSLAPVITIDQDTFGRLTPDEARKIVKNHGS